MLKSICSRCGAEKPYRSLCPCRVINKRAYDKRYNALQRDVVSAAVYHNKAWEPVRAEAMARDNGLCILCFSQSRVKVCDLVHHITELKVDINRAYDIDNLISLCYRCHVRTHKAYVRDGEGVREKLYAMISEPK